MKAIKKLSILFVSVTGIVFFLTGIFPGSAQAQKATEWRLISSWGPDHPQVKRFLIPFVDEVNKRSGGRLKISWVGPEAVPPFEQLKPVREGIFDASYTHSAYHMGEIAVGMGMDLFFAKSGERRAAGLYKIVDEAYRKKGNVTYVAGCGDGVGYHLMLKKKIDKADLTGLKIRTSPFYDPMIKDLGGAPVRIAGGEIYTALEKGVVDGACWPAMGALDYKWYEVAKYMVRPRFGEPVELILVNLNSWNRLPKDLQDLLTKIATEIEGKGRVAMVSSFENEEKELQKRGMELLTLPPKEAEKYLNAFYERSWEELVLKRDSEFGPRLKEAVDRMRKK
jgi:TRAP-type C4-dicarboxylate transport system substrate-binding protein